MPLYADIADTLSHLRYATPLQVVVQDFSAGFSRDEALHAVIKPYEWHANAYCMAVKQDRRMWDRCIEAKPALLRALQRADGDSVMRCCPFGVVERAWPVCAHTGVVAAVVASGYRADEERAQHCLRCAQRRHQADACALQATYDRALRPRDEACREAECLCGVLAMALSGLYASGRLRPLQVGLLKTHETVARALDYIHSHTDGDIRVRDIASFCSVSESHLQHLFHKARGRGVMKLVADVRLARACALLHDSTLPVRTIAEMTGFSDPNYFSTVFAGRFGQPPSAYRRRERPTS